MKTYVIADLHGRFDLLCKAIDLIEADAGEEGGTLICLGDFVDRGPQSSNIIDLFVAGPQKPNWKWVVLQGNHEAMMLEVLANPEQGQLRWWFGNGGAQTLLSYGYEDGDPLRPFKQPLPAHMHWLRSLPITHEDEHRIYVHAGVVYNQPVAETKPELLQWVLYADHGDPGVPDVPHMSGKHVVHGHHQNAMHPLIKDHRTNLDSFAWHSGRLAIGVFDETQSKPVKIMDAIGRPYQ